MTLTIDDLLKRSEQSIEAVSAMRKAWKEGTERGPVYSFAEEDALANQFNLAILTRLQESLACSQLAQTRILLNVSSLGDTEDTIRFYDSYAWELRNLR